MRTPSKDEVCGSKVEKSLSPPTDTLARHGGSVENRACTLLLRASGRHRRKDGGFDAEGAPVDWPNLYKTAQEARGTKHRQRGEARDLARECVRSPGNLRGTPALLLFS